MMVRVEVGQKGGRAWVEQREMGGEYGVPRHWVPVGT